MDFRIPAEITAYLAALDAFIDKEIKPLQAQDDNERFFDHRREWARTDFENDGVPRKEARFHRRGRQKNRLLLDHRDAQAVADAQLAVVQRHAAGDGAEQRGLSGAVPADEADALARLHRERGAVEQRQLAVGELGVLESQDRQVTSSSSTSNTSVAFGGITPPQPWSP